jgi:hypothetical protein
VTPEPEPCPRCHNNGVILSANAPAEWCDCEKAAYIREKAPDFVADWNERRVHPAPLIARVRVARKIESRSNRLDDIFRNWGLC